MAEDRIDSIIDIQAVKQQFVTVQGYLDNLALQLKNFQVIPSGFNSASIQQLTNANNQYSASLQSLNNTATSFVDSQKKLVVMQEQLTAATKSNTESLQDNIQARIRVKNSMESYLASQKEDLALLKAGTISRAEYNRRLIESNVKVEQYKNQLLVLNKEIKNQTLTAAQQGGAYALLNKEYIEAQKNAKNLAVIYGIESAEAKAAAASALALNTQLQAIDKTVGLSQRNVGNYGSVFQRAFGGLRTLANILPGVGISGILLFAIEPIMKWITAINEATGAAKRLEEQKKLIKNINDAASESYGKEAGKLNVLRSSIESVSAPMATRLQAIKDLRKLYPDYFSELSNEQLLTGKVANAYDLAAASILRKAKATAAATEIEKIEAEKQKILLQNEIDYNEAQSKIAAARDQVITRKGLGDNAGTQYTNTAEAQKAGIRIAYNIRRKAAQDEIDQLNKKEDFLLKIALDGAKEEIKIEKEKIEAKNKISDNTGESTLQAMYNINKRIIQLNIDKNKDIAESDKYTIIRRLDALQQFAEQSTALVDLEQAYELAAEDLKLKKIKESLDEQKKEKGANIKAITEQQEKEEKASAARRLDIENKFTTEKIKLLKENLKIADDITQDNEKKQQLRGLERVREYFKEKARVEKENEDKLKKQREDAAKEQLNLNKQLLSELQSTFFAFLNNSIIAQQNQLDEKKRLLDEATARQINQINLLGINEVERTQRIAEVQKQAAYQSEQIEKRKRALAVQQAKFQKAADATSIITSTAAAVIKIFKDYKYITAVPLAAATAAIGALQLARVLSAPLPKYAKGTSSAKAGFAIAGEIGAELVTERSGKMYLTPDVPTLMHFRGGEKITPANITKDILNAANIKALATIQPKSRITESDVNTAILSDIKRQLVLANRKQQPSWNIQHGIEATPWFNKHFKQ